MTEKNEADLITLLEKYEKEHYTITFSKTITAVKETIEIKGHVSLSS